MTQPIPPMFDWGNFIAVFIPCVTLFSGWAVYVRALFKSKKEEKAEFIERIVDGAVKKTLDTVLSDVRADIQLLFKYREDDRKHYDNRFDAIMSKIGK